MDYSKLTDSLLISGKTTESPDAFSLTFAIPETLKEKFKYSAGQFVTLFISVDGKDVRRSYSLSSSPDWDQDFRISVKRVPGGLVSNYLADHVEAGQSLNVTPPAGRFVLPDNLDNNTLVFFAGGSGITPILSLMKSALKRSETCKIFLLYANRDEYSIMFQRELASINSNYHARFRFEYILSNPMKPWNGIKGRITAEIVKEFWARNKISTMATSYMCGPEGFMSVVEDSLKAMGLPSKQIIKESFVSPATLVHEAPASTAVPTSETGSYLDEIGPGAVLIGDKKSAAEPKTLKVNLNGERIEVSAKPNQSVLETLLEEGYNPPYSCMDGACMACIGKVKSGLVYQDDMGILTEDNTDMMECLTCQAKPASTSVEIDYDM